VRSELTPVLTLDSVAPADQPADEPADQAVDVVNVADIDTGEVPVVVVAAAAATPATPATPAAPAAPENAAGDDDPNRVEP
jgi:hypothetical protein